MSNSAHPSALKFLIAAGPYGTNFITRHLKKVFWLHIIVGGEIQIIVILEYASDAIWNQMIPRAMIKVFKLIAPEDKTELSNLEAILAPGITRVPVLDSSGALRYLIHKGVLAEFRAGWQGTGPPTLADLAGNPKVHALIYDATVFVSETASAGEAKAKMDSEPACQDVIVTKNGKRDEPVLGWLTNIELGKISRI